MFCGSLVECIVPIKDSRIMNEWTALLGEYIYIYSYLAVFEYLPYPLTNIVACFFFFPSLQLTDTLDSPLARLGKELCLSE